jgi:hypothetical protein
MLSTGLHFASESTRCMTRSAARLSTRSLSAADFLLRMRGIVDDAIFGFERGRVP